MGQIAPDLGSSSRRAKGCILYVFGLWRNTEDDYKDKQDGALYLISSPKSFHIRCSFFYDRLTIILGICNQPIQFFSGLSLVYGCSRHLDTGLDIIGFSGSQQSCAGIDQHHVPTGPGRA